MVGTGRGARAGILICNAEELEIFGKVDTLIIDKTGTLTEGKPTLNSVLAQSGIEKSDMLQLAAGLERYSEHTLAEAIVRGAEARKLSGRGGRVQLRYRQGCTGKCLKQTDRGCKCGVFPRSRR